MDEVTTAGTGGHRPSALLLRFPKQPFRILQLEDLPGGQYAMQCIEMQNMAHAEQIALLQGRLKKRKAERLRTGLLIVVSTIAAASSAVAISAVAIKLMAAN